MLRDDLGEGTASTWLRPSQFWVGLSPTGGTSGSIGPVPDGGGGRENVCCADVVTESAVERCTSFGVGFVGRDCEMATTKARASLDSSRLRVLIADNTHWGFLVG